MQPRLIAAELTAEAFAAYGDVIEVPAEGGRTANAGTARRFDDLAALELTDAGGVPMVSLFRARPAALPFAVRRLERHPLSTQLFMPLEAVPFLVIVAAGAQTPVEPEAVRAFLASGRQGINYRRGVWHHPLVALHRDSDFLMLGRRGPGSDCDLAELQGSVTVVPPSGACTSSIIR